MVVNMIDSEIIFKVDCMRVIKTQTTMEMCFQ